MQMHEIYFVFMVNIYCIIIMQEIAKRTTYSCYMIGYLTEKYIIY